LWLPCSKSYKGKAGPSKHIDLTSQDNVHLILYTTLKNKGTWHQWSFAFSGTFNSNMYALTAYSNISSQFINSLKSLRWAAEANVKHEPSYRFAAVTRLTVMRKRCSLTQQNPKEVKKKHKHQKRERQREWWLVGGWWYLIILFIVSEHRKMPGLLLMPHPQIHCRSVWNIKQSPIYQRLV